MPKRQGLQPKYLLTQNIRALLLKRGQSQTDLAFWCGHGKAWLNKILQQDRGVKLEDLGKIADFFGLTIADLFQYGIDPLLERRQHQRRTGRERRAQMDRRQDHGTDRLSPDSQPFKRKFTA